MPAPPPSSRLLRAAAAERVEIARHRARMVEEAEELRRALARVERGMIELDERRALLDRLAPPEETAVAAGDARGGGAGVAPGENARGGGAGGDARGRGAGDDARGRGSGGVARAGDDARRAGVAGDRGAVVATDETRGGLRGDTRVRVGAGQDLLRGPEIREAAVKVLIRSGEEGLHYRDWFALLLEQGHAIAGKDPLAVFLTQLGRSPAIRRGAAAGVYELDRHAPARHRTQLEHLQRELRELTVAPGTDLTEIRARRERLNTEIGREERALEEIARVLGPGPPLAQAS